MRRIFCFIGCILLHVIPTLGQNSTTAPHATVDDQIKNAEKQAFTSISTPLAMDKAVRYGILENGLTYYIRHNDYIPERADFYIVHNVGAVLEEDYQDGLAHFLEHMAFNGTKNFPDKGIITYLEKIGVKFGADINAYTAQDQTVYNLCDVPTSRIGIVDTSLMILHDWSGLLTLDPTEIDKERGVIREEWRTRTNAQRRMWAKSLPLLYGDSRYGKRDITGDTAIINNFKPEVLREFYQKWYRPDLQAVIIVGDIDVDYIEKNIKKLFADIPQKKNAVERPYYNIPDNDTPIVAIMTDPEASRTIVSLDYRHQPLSDAQKASFIGYTTSIHNSLISIMISSRLQEIGQKPDAPYVVSYAEYGDLVRTKDVFELITIAKEGKEQACFDTLIKEAQRMDKYGFTTSELERAKIELLSSIERAYNERNKTSNNSYVREYINNYLEFEPIPGVEWEYETMQRVLPQISLDAINKTAKKYVTEKNIAVTITAPEKNKSKLPTKADILSSIEKSKSLELKPYVDNFEQKALISKLPKLGKIKKERKIEKFNATELTLSNGAKVIIKPTTLKENEILINAYSKGGISLFDNETDVRAATFAEGFCEGNGLGEFNNIDLEKQLAGKKAWPSAKINLYSQSLSGSTTKKDLETMMQMIFLKFSDPRKDDEAFATTKNKYKSSLENKYLDPNRIFYDSIQRVVYSDNMYVRPQTAKDIETIKQEDVLNAYKKCFSTPKNFTFYFVGSINVDELKPLICKYIASIPNANTLGNWTDRGIRKAKGKKNTLLKKKMNIDKTSNFIIINGEIEYNLENKVALKMLSDILYTRYFESMRENEGGTYGAHVNSSLSHIPTNEGTLQISFETDPKLQDKLIEIVHDEINKIIKEGPLENDILKVKENLRSRYASNQKLNGWWLNTIMQYNNDGIDVCSDYINIVEKMTASKLKETLKMLIEQGNETIITMQPEK